MNANTTGVYRVEHPAWRVQDVEQPYLLCNVKALYGESFEPFLRHRPRSAFLAEGSPIAVTPGQAMHVAEKKKPARGGPMKPYPEKDPRKGR